jgi:hypothetical protein
MILPNSLSFEQHIAGEFIQRPERQRHPQALERSRSDKLLTATALGGVRP